MRAGAPDPGYASIGHSLSRVEGRAKVTGQAVYTAQVSVPGVLTAAILRSPLPHARICRVAVSRAAAMPGVHAVLTGQDLLAGWVEPYFGVMVRDQSILAIDRVRYVGEPVAAVAADTPECAAAALEQIDVDYAELPPALDVDQALAEGAPRLHDKRELAARGGLRAGVLWHLETPDNVISRFHQAYGDADAGLATADQIIENAFSVPPVHHAQLERHVTIAWWEPDGTLELWDSTQHPYTVRQHLAGMFRLPVNKVRVRVPMVGGGFGGKSYLKLEPLAAALAHQARRPVQVELTREEDFYLSSRHGARIQVRTGVRQDGAITAWDMRIQWDAGAYAENSPLVARNAGVGGGGPYHYGALRIVADTVYTNKVPAGSFRGYGTPQVTWAVEQQIDAIAAALGLDPVDYRLRLAVADGVTFHTGEAIQGVAVQECLRQVRAALPPLPAAGVAAPATRLRRGRGYAAVIMGTTAPTASTAQVRLEEDGGLTLQVTAVEVGQGTLTVLTQIVAELLAVAPERIRVSPVDTAVTPYDRSTSASLTTFRLGRALALAAADLKQQLFTLAGRSLEVDAADLECRDGAVQVVGWPDRRIRYADLVRAAFGGGAGSLTGKGEFQTGYGQLDLQTGQGTPTPFWDTGACGCEVEVDTETGSVRVLDLVVAADVGKALNPELCHGQLQGAAGMALGHTLFEEMVFAGGQLLNPNFLDYGLLTAAEATPIRTLLVEHPHPVGPFGAHGVGETAMSPVAPAVANAIAAACGLRIRDLPITAEKVLCALRLAVSRRSGRTEVV